MSLLEGKTAVVTGGGSGIGRATALLLAREGANVVVTDVVGPNALAVADEIHSEGGRAVGMRVDVTSEPDVIEMVSVALREFGRLDCAVNSAGISMAPAAFTDLTLADWNRMIGIALTGMFLTMKHELTAMERNADQPDGSRSDASAGSGATGDLGSAGDLGSIVNISSGAGFTPAPGQPHYTAAKHAVLGLTKSAAREYATRRIRVNAICPGMTDTPMLREHLDQAPEMEKMIPQIAPSGRLAMPEEMAHTAVWLCSQRASYISGESIVVDYAGLCR